MNPKRLKIRLSLLWIGLFCALSVGVAQAQFVINGFGLSGGVTILDSVVAAGEDIFVVLTVDVPEDWTINGVGDSVDSRFQLTGYFYSAPLPFANPSQFIPLVVDSTSFQVNTGVTPQRVSFRATLPEVLANNLRSVQLVASVIGTDGEGLEQHSELVSSFIDVGGIPAVADSVDAQHRSFLEIDAVDISRPTITSPEQNTTVGRVFTVQYDQPLTAVRHSLVLVIREIPEIGGLFEHRLYLADSLAGEEKEIVVNGLNLGQSIGVDSLGGPASLNHRSRLFFRLFYTVAGVQGERTDTSFVDNVFVDLLTEIPILTEPRVGSESPETEIRVIYRLFEKADTVQLIFTLDSLSLVEDDLSPHILTLDSNFYGVGEHYLILEGRNIGTGGQNVQHSNNGPDDLLVEQALYNVTLSYGDEINNPIAAVTNDGYIWPEDLTTVPPRLLAPLSTTVDNNSFWVQFELPEAPLVGSVFLLFSAFPVIPGSPHTIHLGDLAASGITGLFLNSQALDLSGAPVTSVEGANFLTHDSRYFVRVFYQDHYGNEEASSTARLARYDGATEAPTIISPIDDDLLAFEGTEVIFAQPERATPGTIRLVLEQTGGPETDLFSPHTMFLSDADSGSFKTVVITPAFIGPGEGIDSVQNAGSLVARGRYRLSLMYQDVLANSVATTFVRDLYFPSGSAVAIHGSALSTQVIPGASNVALLQFGLTAIGESALRGIRLGVEGGLLSSDVIATKMILWSSIDTLLQTDIDQPLDSLDGWIGGDMVWDSISFALDENEKNVIVSGSFPSNADPINSINLVLRSGDDVDCGGDPVACSACPIGMPDIALPVLISSMYVEQDTTFTSLVINWIAESEYNVLGFRLWRSDNENTISAVVASYADHEELYGRGNAAAAKRYRYIDRNLRSGVTYTYSLDVIGMDGLTVHPIALTASGSPSSAPSNFQLRKVYPNPFNQEATIEYVVPIAETVDLSIYNLLGQKVRQLLNAQLAPSVYRSHWNGQNDQGLAVPSGLYLVRMRAAGRFDSIQKLLLVR